MRVSLLILYIVTIMLGGGTSDLYFRLDTILVKGLSPAKHTLNTYFQTLNTCYCMFFPELSTIVSFPKLMTIIKNTPFFPVLYFFAKLFYPPKQCMRIHCLVLNKQP